MNALGRFCAALRCATWHGFRCGLLGWPSPFQFRVRSCRSCRAIFCDWCDPFHLHIVWRWLPPT